MYILVLVRSWAGVCGVRLLLPCCSSSSATMYIGHLTILSLPHADPFAFRRWTGTLRPQPFFGRDCELSDRFLPRDSHIQTRHTPYEMEMDGF